VSNWQFGDMLKHMRKQNKIGLREAAKMLSMDPGNLSKLENGFHPPPKNGAEVMRFVKLLGLEPGWAGMLLVTARKYHVDKIYDAFDV